MLPGILPCWLISLQTNLYQSIREENSLGNIFLRVNTFGLLQDTSPPTSQTWHWRKAELAGCVSSHFLQGAKQIFIEKALMSFPTFKKAALS